MTTILELILAAAGALGLDGRLTQLNHSMHKQIKMGMSEDEVNRLIGAKGFVYWNRWRPQMSGGTRLMDEGLKSGQLYGRTWYGRTCTVDVIFSPTEGVKSIGSTWPGRGTPLAEHVKKWQYWLLSQQRDRMRTRPLE